MIALTAVAGAIYTAAIGVDVYKRQAVLCAAGFNLRWLLRSIAGGRIKPIFWACFLWSLSTIRAISAMLVLPDAHKCSEPTNRMPALLRVRAEFATI